QLKNIADSPLVLYAQGKIEKTKLGIGIVGSRRCSDYGRKVSNFLAKELASYGVNIISGLAFGIDKAAHIGALQADGYTTAVLGGGIHACYPKEHQKLFDEIKEKGCILSEEMYGCETKPFMFPKRNRIISGISHGVLIVEAAKKSGSLITADFALEQGKEVFTIPHRLFDGFAEGSNNLTRQGAKMVYCAEDILQEFVQFDKKIKENNEKIEKELDEMEKIVYSCISYEPSHIENIFGKINGTTMEDLHYYLLLLEMKGLIHKKSGCYYARSEV
ncbi:MAG: DNA-processing protein DprA, partial [Vallitaleaceae bacterium]|nr:DNA-processing protein DprA [Vallitaleaceae bacterium]